MAEVKKEAESSKKEPVKKTVSKTAAAPADDAVKKETVKKATAKKSAEVSTDEPKKEPAKKPAPKKQYVTWRAEDRKWVVKKEGSDKATKLFNTKAEAEEFARTIAENQGSTVVRQKKDGKFQKEKY